jgi:hypothetical protein
MSTIAIVTVIVLVSAGLIIFSLRDDDENNWDQ